MNTKRVLYVLLAVALVALSYGIYAAIANHGDLIVGLNPYNPGNTGSGDIENDGDDEIDPIDIYDCNVDLRNDGPEAYDLAIVFKGRQEIDTTETYNGYKKGSKTGWFDEPTVTYDETKDQTILHWQGFKDDNNDGTDDDNIINTGQIIHVGWFFEGKDSEILDMYWTDINGDRVAGSKVYLTDTGHTYELESGRLGATWVNIYENRALLTVSEVYYAYVPEKINLADLNAENDTLNNLYQPAPGGETIAIPYNYQYTLELPAGAEIGTNVVLRYKVSGPDSNADVVNYFQFTIE